MRRRKDPYSCIEAIRHSRKEVLSLVLVTVLLGFLLGVLSDSLAAVLRESLSAPWWGGAIALAGVLVVLLAAVAAWFLYWRAESQRVAIDLWLPYHFPSSRQVAVVDASSYQPPRHARRAFARRYRRRSPALSDFLESLAESRAQGELFHHFIAADHLALARCLALYVLHRYGDESLGPEAPYGWWGVELGSERLSMDDLPPSVGDNPFLRADQRAEEWRLLLPEGITFRADGLSWTLRHRCYGQVTVRWFPELLAAGPERRPYRALTTRMRLSPSSELYVVGVRVEARVTLRRALLPSSEPFHGWATGLLARLEEALDFEYYLATKPDRVIRDLEWKLGWVPEGTSLVEMLQVIQGRLEGLEAGLAGAAVEEPEDEGDPFVV